MSMYVFLAGKRIGKSLFNLAPIKQEIDRINFK